VAAVRPNSRGKPGTTLSRGLAAGRRAELLRPCRDSVLMELGEGGVVESTSGGTCSTNLPEVLLPF